MKIKIGYAYRLDKDELLRWGYNPEFADLLSKSVVTPTAARDYLYANLRIENPFTWRDTTYKMYLLFTTSALKPLTQTEYIVL